MKNILFVLILPVLIVEIGYSQGITSVPFQEYSNSISLHNTWKSGRDFSRFQTANNWGKLNIPQNLLPDEYVSWESEKHFGAALGELAILEFIPSLFW